MISLKVLCWIIIALQLYIYLGYPFVVMVLARLRRRLRGTGASTFEPRVSLIIPARNEAGVMEQKLQNSLQLEYLKGKLEIIVISDHSTDNTEAIVERFHPEAVRLIALSEQQGKTKSQNIAVKEASGEILVFSDANAMYAPSAVRRLVTHFRDPDVGCVSGELCYVDTKGNVVGREENVYWKYEKFIKKQEARTGSILGANGSIYAVRKSDYVPLEQGIISDFIEPLEIVVRGKKVVYEAAAISWEETSLSFREEFIRKRRIVSRSIRSLIVHRRLLDPFRSGLLAFKLLSHKVLRWFSPFFMVFLFAISSILAARGGFEALFLLQVGFYFIAFLGWGMRDQSRWPAWIFVPFYICLMGYASILGIIDFVRGKAITVWEPSRS